MNITYREMDNHDYDSIVDLWKRTKGIGITSSDTREKISLFLGKEFWIMFCRHGQWNDNRYSTLRMR